LDQILQSPKVFGPLTKLQCCPTSDGAGCAIIASEKFVREHGLMDQAVEIVAQAMATDSPKMLSTDGIEWAGSDMTRKAAATVFKKAGITANDVQVVELHDCFSANEVVKKHLSRICAVDHFLLTGVIVAFDLRCSWFDSSWKGTSPY
jgi:sterol carrier protein 2